MHGIKPQTLALGVAGLLLLGAFVYGLSISPSLSPSESDVNALPSSEQMPTEMVEGEMSTSSNATPSVVSNPSKPTESKPVPPKTNSSGNQTTPAQPSTPQIEPESEVTVVKPYDPGFLASSRVTPEIPSESERAVLPSCEGKVFTMNPVELSVVTSVSPGSTSGGVTDHVLFKVVGNGEQNKYDLIAPGDVWLTHIAQESGISVDSNDTTVYFALCKDVFAYISHVKELSPSIYKYVTDSTCLGKPHTGPNACHIKLLELISRGSSLGKVGRLEGEFGIGVIDLRKERGLANASTYSVKTNFGVCPFEYFSKSDSFFAKASSVGTFCVR